MQATQTVPHTRIEGLEKPVSRIIHGSMFIKRDEKEKTFELLDAGLAAGITAIDVAHVYGGGETERCLGDWIEARNNREDIVVLTKGSHHNADRKRVTPFDIFADCHDSLARMRVEYFDIYLLHRDDPSQPVGPIVEALNQLKDEGKIKVFGGSNWTHQRLQEANEYAEANGLAPFSISSPHFSLAEQVDDPWGPGCVGISGPNQKEAQAWYRANQMPVFAYSSLARGLFSGRLTSENVDKAEEIFDRITHKAYCHPVNYQRLERAEQLAAKLNLTIAQVAMAYVLNYPLNLYAIASAANLEQLGQNVEASNVKLTDAQVAWLDLESDSPAG